MKAKQFIFPIDKRKRAPKSHKTSEKWKSEFSESPCDDSAKNRTVVFLLKF